MRKFGEVLKDARKARRISLGRAAKDLLIKEEDLASLENEDWGHLPDPTFTRGFTTSYAKYLGLDPQQTLALYRREYDEKQYPKKQFESRHKKRFYLTPAKLLNTIILLSLIVFISYLAVQYSSILKAPKVEIISPPDDETVSVPVLIVQGKTETQTTISVDGEFVPVNPEGTFTYQYNLKEGKNTIEVIASKRLSPKTKITRTVRLSQ